MREVSLDLSRAAVSSETVQLAVCFKLTELEQQPVSPAPVRLVLGAIPGWQNADAGLRFTTDVCGLHRLETQVRLEPRRRKRPTNFVDQLFSRPEPTFHLQVAAELEYAGRRWLYVAAIDHFTRDGDVLLTGFTVYSADQAGAFTCQAKATDAGWLMPGLGGLVLTTPGYKIWDFGLQPAADAPAQDRWTLDLGFSRFPAPILR